MASSSNQFIQSLESHWDNNQFVCIGLDTDYAKLPARFQGSGSKAEAVSAFNRAIVDATYDQACAYKPNTAYYELLGPEGLIALAGTIRYIKNTYPTIPVILDAKKGDIGSTNEKYAEAAFDELGVDAITVHPYLGRKSLEPFLERADKGVIIMGANSNSGAGEFQDLKVAASEESLYKYICRQIAETWNKNGNCIVTAGATEPHKIEEIRNVVGDMPILVLGVGKQGGNIKDFVRTGKAARNLGMIINSSRSILYASHGNDFAAAAHESAQELNAEIKHELGMAV